MARFTASHMNKVCELLKDAKPKGNDFMVDWDDLVERFANMFARSNANFNEALFRRGCGQYPDGREHKA